METELKELKSVLRAIVVSSPTQVDVRTLQCDYPNLVGAPIPLAKHGYRDLLSFLKEKCSDCFLIQGMGSNPEVTLIVPETLKHIDQLVRNQKMSQVDIKNKGRRRSVPERITRREICSDATNMIAKQFHKSHESGQSNTETGQLEVLELEICELIREYQEGILVTDLMRLYRERHERELVFYSERFGYNSVNNLLGDMHELALSMDPDGFRMRVRYAALQHSAAPEPCPRPRPLLPPLVRRPAQASHLAPPDDPDVSLPGIDCDPDVFPPDCMQLMEIIPALPLGDIRPGTLLEVTVVEVYSPSHFWLQRLGEQYSMAVNDMKEQMSIYYNFGEGKSLQLARGAIKLGHYCSSKFGNDWRRSLIINIIDSDTVKVRYLDYGSVVTVRADTLRPLPRRWGALPAQAIRARHTGLRPPAAALCWPHSAAAHFLGLVLDTTLIANVVALHPEENTLETFLINMSGPGDFCVSTEMIRSGHADTSNLALMEGDLYPHLRFDVLESGGTPSFAEIRRFLTDGNLLDNEEAYRRHVPAALPTPTPSLARATPPISPSPSRPPPSQSSWQMPDLSQPPPPRPGYPPHYPPRRGCPPRPGCPPFPGYPPLAAPMPVRGAAGTPQEGAAVEVRLKVLDVHDMLKRLDPLAARCYLRSALNHATARLESAPTHDPAVGPGAGARLHSLNPYSADYRRVAPPPPYRALHDAWLGLAPSHTVMRPPPPGH